jgi:hypothetical protein
MTISVMTTSMLSISAMTTSVMACLPAAKHETMLLTVAVMTHSDCHVSDDYISDDLCASCPGEGSARRLFEFQ